MPLIAWALLWLNIAAYVVLWRSLLAPARPLRPRACSPISRDHARGPGFFTVVAGTCVLGSQCVIVGGRAGAAPRALDRRASCSGWS